MAKRSVACLILTLTACASSLGNRYAIRMRNVDSSLGDIRAAAAAMLPAGQWAVSPNGREILSRHFVLEGKEGYRSAGDALERYFAQVLVLGDRRPYDIEILVTEEKRVFQRGHYNYVVVGHDSRLAQELESKLQAELTKRREDRNIIDDFRVF